MFLCSFYVSAEGQDYLKTCRLLKTMMHMIGSLDDLTSEYHSKLAMKHGLDVAEILPLGTELQIRVADQDGRMVFTHPTTQQIDFLSKALTASLILAYELSQYEAVQYPEPPLVPKYGGILAHLPAKTHYVEGVAMNTLEGLAAQSWTLFRVPGVFDGAYGRAAKMIEDNYNHLGFELPFKAGVYLRDHVPPWKEPRGIKVYI